MADALYWRHETFFAEPGPFGGPAPASARHSSAFAAAEHDHAAGALRRPHRYPARLRGQARNGARGHRVCRGARRHRRPARPVDEGPVEVRRRTRQPCRLHELRLRAGAVPLSLGIVRTRQRGLDRGHGVCDLRGAAPRALQCHDRRSPPADLGGQLLHRRAGTGRRAGGAAADLSEPARIVQDPGGGDAALHAGDRGPDGVAAAGVFRQAGRQARSARDGAAGLRRGRAVRRSADRLSVVGALDRHACSILRRLPLGWMSYQEYQRRDAAASQSPPAVDIDQTMPPQPPQEPERPARLN